MFKKIFLLVAVLAFCFAAPARAFTNLFSTTLVSASSQYWNRTVYDATLNPSGSTLTVAGWVKLPTPGVGSLQTIAGMAPNNSDWSYVIGLSGGGQAIILTKAGGNQVAKAGGTTLSANTWYHIAMTYDGSTMTVYLNGVSDGTIAQSGTLFSNSPTGRFIIGASNDGTVDSLLNGQIDDVRVWSRSLSSSEILSLKTTPCTFNNGANLLGWWQLENNGTDSSGNGFTLTNTNAATFTGDVPYVCAATASFNPGSIWEL